MEAVQRQYESRTVSRQDALLEVLLDAFGTGDYPGGRILYKHGLTLRPSDVRPEAVWYLKNSGMAMATIEGSTFCSLQGNEARETHTLQLSGDGREITIPSNDNKHGWFTDDGNLVWDDGDVWCQFDSLHGKGTLPLDDRVDLLQNFDLTVEKVYQMIALYYRLRSKMPVVLMGVALEELVKYFSTLTQTPCFCISVNAGMQPGDVLQMMTEPVQVATDEIEYTESNNGRTPFVSLPQPVWVYFDDITAADCEYLFREMICNGSINGVPLPQNVTVFASAASPPESMRDWVWDFDACKTSGTGEYLRS
jgi:hypothetical protein